MRVSYGETSCTDKTCFSGKKSTRIMKGVTTGATDMLHTDNIFCTSMAAWEMGSGVLSLAVMSLQYAKDILIQTVE